MNDPGLDKGDQQLIFSWPVQSEPAVKGQRSPRSVYVCAVGINLVSTLSQTSSKTRGRLFSSAISALDMCTISNTLFGPARNKAKV